MKFLQDPIVGIDTTVWVLSGGYQWTENWYLQWRDRIEASYASSRKCPPCPVRTMPLDWRHDKQIPSSQAELNTTRLEANPYQRGGLKAYFGDPQILTYLMALRQYGIAATPVRIKPIQIQFRCFSKFDMYGNSPTPANKQRFIPTSGSYPKGFLAGGTSIGIKPARNSRPDLVLVASERPCCGAALFTRNEFPAASITVTKDLVRKSKGRGLRGVIVNSGCANTLTGKAGLEDAAAMSKEADKHISAETGAERESSVMVMHTGVGGQRLPMKDIIQSIPKLHENMGSSHSHWLEAAKGICTTDTFPKLASRTFGLPSLPNTTFSLAGITKGAGMIHPNMATTLGIICTDAPITPPALQHLLSTAASTSYNSISIDGDTSTNDMVAMLANGAAAPNETQDIDYCPSSPHQSPDFLAFQHILDDFMATMAKLVVRDGEGASKFITIRVRNSPSSAAGAAKHIASVIARSVLVKTAIYGEEANWGGVLAALGYSLIDTEYEGKGVFDPALTSVSFLAGEEREEVKFLERGVPVRVKDERVRGVMERGDVEVLVDLRDEGNGREVEREEAVYWTCDLTHEFVTMNGGFLP